MLLSTWLLFFLGGTAYLLEFLLFIWIPPLIWQKLTRALFFRLNYHHQMVVYFIVESDYYLSLSMNFNSVDLAY